MLDNDLYPPIVRSAFGARIVGDWPILADSTRLDQLARVSKSGSGK
jgi:hypothetical protein